MNIRKISILCQECGNDIKWKGAWTEMPYCRCGWRLGAIELAKREHEHEVATTVVCGYCATHIYRQLGAVYLHETLDLDQFIGIGGYPQPRDTRCPSCKYEWRVKKDDHWYFRTADGKLKPERGRELSEFELTTLDGEG